MSNTQTTTDPISHEEALRLWHESQNAHRRNSAFEWFAAGLLAGHRRVSAEVARLNEWADSFTDAHLKERQTGDALVKEVRGENAALALTLYALAASHPPVQGSGQ